VRGAIIALLDLTVISLGSGRWTLQVLLAIGLLWLRTKFPDLVAFNKALGDIGVHFPPSDARWKDADSRAFVRPCNALILARGWRGGNCDITVICERPKVGPHALAMREVIAADLGIDLDAVSVKATTSEQLGFTGRGEGIAAQAACLLVHV